MINKILNSRRYFIYSLLTIVLFSLILNIVIYYYGIFSISADESGRTIHAYKWVTGTYQAAPTWLPFYTYIVGYGLIIFPDLFVTPRIIISLFGVLAFISFIWLTQELFKDRHITLLSAIIALFFPSRAILSSVPLSESIFFFFVFTGIALFIKWVNTGNNNLIFLSALSFAVSSSVRYEGWIFASVYIFILVIFKRLKAQEIKVNTIITVSLICVIFPVYWLIYQGEISGNPINFFSAMNKHYEHSVGISLYTVLKNNYLTRFVHHNLIYLCFPGLFMLVYLFAKENRFRKLVSLPLLAFIPLVLISFVGKGIPTHNIWRIPELWNILLIPFTAYFIKNINSFELKYLKGMKRTSVSLIIVLVLVYYSFHIYGFKDESNFTIEEIKIGRYIEQNLIEPESKNKILIEVPDWSFLHIIVASNHPESFVKSSDGGNPRIKKDQTIIDESKIELNQLSEKNIKYIMVKSPDLKGKIKHKPFIKERKKFKEWYIFQIR